MFLGSLAMLSLICFMALFQQIEKDYKVSPKSKLDMPEEVDVQLNNTERV